MNEISGGVVNATTKLCRGKTANLADNIPSGGQWVEYAAPPGLWFNLMNFTALGTAPDGIFYSLT